MRYELSDDEWTAIKPMRPNKPRSARRVNDRRVLFGSSVQVRPGEVLAHLLPLNPFALSLCKAKEP